MRDLILTRLTASEGAAAERVRSNRHPHGIVVRGDRDLNPGLPAPPQFRLAAVLVPIIERAAGMTVLLTQRTQHLADHAGQISFPGGRTEESDPSPVATALRETEEEVGLDRRHVTVVGRLDTYETGTGYRVTPVVGLVAPDFSLRLDQYEVAEAFEVPLSFVLDRGNHLRHSRVIKGTPRQFYALPFGDRYIWGATAGMLVNLADVLGG